MIGELSALGSALSWALVSVLLRNLQFSINALSLNAFRSLVAALLVLAAVIVAGKQDALYSIHPQAAFYLVASVLVGMGIGDTLYFYSLKLVGIVRALPLSNVYPIFAAIIAFFLHGELLTIQFVMGTLLVIAGVIMVLMPGRPIVKDSTEDGRRMKLGIALALAASLLWGCGTNIVKLGSAEVDSLAANTLRLGAASIALMAAARISRGGCQLREYRGRQLFGVVVAGVLSAFSAFAFLIAIQTIGAAKTATLASTSPLFGVPLSLLVGERLTGRIVLGSIVSITGICVVVIA